MTRCHPWIGRPGWPTAPWQEQRPPEPLPAESLTASTFSTRTPPVRYAYYNRHNHSAFLHQQPPQSTLKRNFSSFSTSFMLGPFQRFCTRSGAQPPGVDLLIRGRLNKWRRIKILVQNLPQLIVSSVTKRN